MPEQGPLGILGGTFDPVHRAHLHLARAAVRQLGLASVVWIPAGQPWHRQAVPRTPAQHRLAMVRVAVAGEPAFRVDDTEARSETPSYTVPTLERLRAEQGAARSLVLLMGADAFLGLQTWHRWRELFELAHVAVAARPGAMLDAAAMPPDLAGQFCSRLAPTLTAAPAGSIVRFEIEPVEPPDLSATAVRELLRSTPQGAADLLPSGVLDYIRSNHLYAT